MRFLFFPYRTSLVLFLAGLLVLLSGCEPSPSERLRQELRARVDSVDGPRASLIDSLYHARDYRPVWLQAGEPTDLADGLIKLVCQSDGHALPAAVYDIQELGQAVEKTYAGGPDDEASDYGTVAALELQFSRLFIQYAGDLLNGRSKQRELTDTWHLEKRKEPLLPVLQEIIQESDVGLLEEHLHADEAYEDLRAVYNRYRDLRQTGGWPTVPTGPRLYPGRTGPRVYKLERRLEKTNDLPDETAPDSVFDRQTSAGVRAFQRRHGLQISDTVGTDDLDALNVSAAQRVRQLAVNLERRRWLPADLAGTRLIVNVPDFLLSVYENDRQAMQMPVIVGERMNETPVFADTLSHVVFRPYWYVPSSIAVESILPQLRDSMEYLEDHRYEIITGDRQAVPEDSLEAAGSREFAKKLEAREWIIRQKPGPTNALGAIKFMFPNAYNIYLHDTPADHLFSREVRTFSHGCIRVQRPVDLADYVLGNEWTADRIQKTLRADGGPMRVPVEQQIPVYILYLTAWTDQSGRVHFRPDVYGHDSLLWAAIEGTKIGSTASTCRLKPDSAGGTTASILEYAKDLLPFHAAIVPF